MTALRGASVREALDSAVVAIAASGSDTPRLDAELLLADALGAERAALVMDPDREVAGPAARAFRDAVRRRAADHEPVAYILGRKAFRRIELAVDRRVLVPRPETEGLVEAVVQVAPRGARVVDVGTGSGAIALALGDERPDLRLTATDLSEEALEVARVNAVRLGIDVAFVRADLLAGAGGPWDVVVCNPPYVEDRAPLPPDVARHEPHGALLAGPDGLDVLRRLVEQAAGVPVLAVEVGAGQAPAVVSLARAAGFADVTTHRDLAGIERVVLARA